MIPGHLRAGEPGQDIWLAGGGQLAAFLVDEIDELILKVNPVVLGAGTPLFDGVVGPRPVTPTGHKVYPNGFALLRYRWSHGPGPSRVPPAEAPSSVRGVPTILYDGRAIEVSEDEFTTLRDHVVELANSGKYDWLLVDPEDPTWLLIGPGIPVSFDQADPPEFPELLP